VQFNLIGTYFLRPLFIHSFFGNRLGVSSRPDNAVTQSIGALRQELNMNPASRKHLSAGHKNKN